MATQFCAAARELEALVARAARLGRLDPAELLPTYVRLMPTAHPHLPNERCFDVQGVIDALAMLPVGLLDAPAVRVVARLEAFRYEPVPGGSFVAGRLEDGTLLIGAGRGIVPLINLAAPLCLLAYEASKARRLLGAAGLVRILGGKPPSETAADVVALDDASLGSDPATLDETEERPKTGAVDPPEQLERDRSADPPAKGQPLAEVAFQLGINEAALLELDERSRGAVLALALNDHPLPEVLIHADLEPMAATRHTANAAQGLLETLAENGLAKRPIHLWVGNDVVTDCVSPYARELREVLLAWARQNAETLDPEIATLLDSPGEDLSYAVMHDFLRAGDGLLDERARADRTVGILRSAGLGLPFEIIDLGRVDPTLCDARLPAWQLEPPAPVLIRLTADLEDDEATALCAVVDALGSQIASVTLLLEGTLLGDTSSGILLPHLMVRWAGEEKLSIPAQAAFDTSELASLTDVPITTGAVLSVSAASLLSAAHVSDLTQMYGVGALQVGSAALVAALADARWKGTLRPDVPVAWALVGVQRLATGRPTVPSLAGCAALAVATLRRIVGQPGQAKATEPQPPLRTIPSQRTMFIKA